MVMGFGCVGGSGVFQPSITDMSIGVFLKTRNLQLETYNLIVKFLSGFSRWICISWCLW